MSAPDPRVNAYRPDLAAAHLRGVVETARFADGAEYAVIEPLVDVRRAPSHEAALDTQALYGERVTVYETSEEGWAWGQLARDGYVGYLPANALAKPGPVPTHTVVVPRTLCFPAPDIKKPPLAALPNIDRILLRSAALEGDLARHPEVALLAKQEDIAASDVRVAQADRRSPPEIAATLAKRDEARAAREEKLRTEVAEMRIRIDEWQHARDRRDRHARQLVPLARERTLATLVAYRGGKTTLTDVLAARRAETEARMQAVEMEREVARIWVRINFALPETLPTASRASSSEERAQ